MIEMSLERGGIGLDDQKVPSIDIVTTKFNLPLLIIIPLNSLGVDSVAIGLKWRQSIKNLKQKRRPRAFLK